MFSSSEESKVLLADASDASDASEESFTGSFDLDEVESESDMVMEEVEDVVCDKCGAAISAGNSICPDCGETVSAVEDLPEPTEDDVDLSDLAEDESPDIWEPDYPGNVDDDDVTVVDDLPVKSGLRLFEGNFYLNAFSGMVSGILGFFFAVALSLLAASQQGVQEYLPYILVTSLTGMVVASIFFSFQSRIPFALAGPETVLTAVLFLFLGAVQHDMVDRYTHETIAATIVAGVAVASFIVGFGLWLIGKLKAGEHVRYVPIQIIGGVIGGIGVFVIIATLDWIGPLTLDWNNLPISIRENLYEMNAMESLYTMGPGVLFGLLLFMGLRKIKNSFFMLGILIIASGAGVIAGVWGATESIRSLSTPIPHLDGELSLLSAMTLFDGYGDIQWSVIKANSLYLGALGMLAVLTAMYRITNLEILQGREADLSVEYRSLGLTNMVAGLCGGMVSTISYGRSAGNHASGGRGPLAGLVTGLVCAVGLYFAGQIIPLVPRFVFEGILVYAGLSLIRDWLFKSKTVFTRSDDMWMLWMTFLTTVLLGILFGIGFGVSLALMVTVSRSSKGGAVRNVLSGANHRSNVDRAPAQQRTLKEFGDHVHILRLQGFLFLGSMTSLLKDIQARLEDKEKLGVEYLILDFRMVTGIASAAGIGFDKLHSLIDRYGIELIITSAPLELEEHLEKSGHVGEEEGMFRVFFNLDYALEWCENHILDSENMLRMKQLTLPELLAPVFPEPKYIPALMKVLKRVQVNKGEAVFRQGDDSDSMYFVESGMLDVELELEGGKLLRLKKIGAGAVFGEMGIYTMAPRSATIRAAEKCVLYMMTTQKLDAVEKRAPMLVTAVNRFLINMLSDRLGDANVKVRDLMM